MITDLLTKSFDDIIDVEYTREPRGRSRQDRAGQDRLRSKTLGEFYKKFKKDLARAGKEMIDLKKGIEIGEACDKCGSPMLKRVGKFGPFIACSAYPECTNTREVEQQEPESENGDEEIEPCENCGRPMAMKRGRFGQFLACTGYPECKTTRKLIATKQGGLRAAKPDQMLDEKCPRCGSNLVVKQGRFGEFTACTRYPECKYVKHKTTGVKCPKDADKGGEIVERKSKRGKVFFGCSNYPDCDFVLWNRPIAEPCPKCAAPFLVEKITKQHGRQLLCNNEDCDYSRAEELVETPRRRNVSTRADVLFSVRASTTVRARQRPFDRLRVVLSNVEARAGVEPREKVNNAHHCRRRARRLRGRLAGGLARRPGHAARDAADAADRGPQDRSSRRAGLQQLVPRRQAR